MTRYFAYKNKNGEFRHIHPDRRLTELCRSGGEVIEVMVVEKFDMKNAVMKKTKAYDLLLGRSLKKEFNSDVECYKWIWEQKEPSRYVIFFSGGEFDKKEKEP